MNYKLKYSLYIKIYEMYLKTERWQIKNYLLKKNNENNIFADELTRTTIRIFQTIRLRFL